MEASGGRETFPPPGFWRFWSGEAVSGFGTYVSLVALQMLVVLTLDGTALEVGLLNSARWLPYLVLGLVIGALVDRQRRRPVMVVSDLVRAVLMASIPAAWAFDLLTLPLLLVIVVAYGTASLVNDAASMSFLPRLVPRSHLQRAHARIDGADAVAQTGGPPLAGLLVSLVGAPITLLVDAASYLFAAVTTMTLKYDEPAPDRARVPNIRLEMAEGIRWIYRESGLASLASSTHVWFAANSILGVVIAPYALLELDLSAFQFGVSAALAGFGALVGSLVTTTIGRTIGNGPAIIVARSITVVGVCVMAAAGFGASGWVAVGVLGAGQCLHGCGMGMSNSHEMAFRQAMTPDALQARTNTTMRSFNRAVIVVVAPLSGLAADLIGLRPALLVAAVIFALSVVILLASPFRSARVDG